MASSTMEESKLPGGYLVTPRVPQGLAAAVEGLTREVIRHSPEDIYVFAAHHFEKLLLLRERCGPEDAAPARDAKNLRTLREMSRALRAREVDRGNVRTTGNPGDQVGWSLNQTAKVLKRHRSIFGEAGRRISTDEVFQMASLKENRSRPPKEPAVRSGSRESAKKKEERQQRPSGRTAEDTWRASTSRTSERSWSNEDSPDATSETLRSGPRIITQIPSLQSSTHSLLAKDIKSELRKNRISSRERRSVRAKPEDRSGTDRGDGKSVTKAPGRHAAPRKTSDRPRRPDTEADRRNRRSVDPTRSSGDQETADSRAPSMDRVKDYVVQRFATTKSLEELQTLNYVEKVQGIIDETGPIIKGKVDQLKSGMIGRSKRSSWFADSRNDQPRGSNGSDDRSEDTVLVKDITKSRDVSADALRTRLTETQNLMENVSSKMSRPRRSRSARSARKSATTSEDTLAAGDTGREIATTLENASRDNGLERRLSKTRNLLEDISSTLSRPMRRSTSAKSLRRQEEQDFGESGTNDALKSRLDETRNLLEGINASFGTHRVESAKGRRCGANGNIFSEDMSLSDTQNASKMSRPRRSRSAKSLRRQEEDDFGDSGTKDALKSRLDETRNLLEGINATFGTHRVGSAKGRRGRANGNLFSEDTSFTDSQNMSKVSLPAVRSVSAKSSSGSVSRSDSDNLVLPSISPEAPKTRKMKEEVTLPVLSPPGTGSSNEASRVEETDIPEIPVEDIVDDVFRDSLNVTPNFDSIPQRPDSLEPPEDGENNEDSPKVGDLQVRLQDIRKVDEEENEEVFTTKTSDPGDSGMMKKLQELEEAEKRIERIFDNEEPEENEDSPESATRADSTAAEVDESDKAGSAEEEIVSRRISGSGSEVNGGKGEDTKDDERRAVDLSAVLPEALDYTYVLTEGSPHEIPDTVTTVIIPDRTVESPVSDRLDSELNDDQDAKLSLASAETPRKASEEAEEIDGKGFEDIEEVDENVIEDEDLEATAVDSKSDVTSQPDVKSPKNGSRSSEEYSSLMPDPFGEVVEPVPLESTSPDVDYIRGINGRQEVHVNHQDLDRINEEMAEESEDATEEAIDVIKGADGIEAVEDTNNEDGEEVKFNPDSPATNEEKNDNEDDEETNVEKLISNRDTPIINEEKIDNEDKKVDEVTSNPDSPVTKEEKEDSEDGIVEATEDVKSPETADAAMETKEENIVDAEEGGPDSPTTKDENEDSEDGKVEASEVIKTPETTEAVMETKEENIVDAEEGGPDSPTTKAENEDSEDEKVEASEVIKTPETTDAAVESKEEDIHEATSSPDAPAIQVEKEDSEVQKTEVDKSKSRTESELSPEALRPYLDSESSNEAKESSGPDELLESAKCANSVDDEDSSATRSPESSNEVKETTLTDGLSLSLDPTRPFVPELNLDSLQDITVSSFKMTEDDYDNHGPAESGNTNSITETLTSDENRRLMENAEFAEEALMEHLTSSSDLSRLEEATTGQEEVIEEPMVKSQVEIKEDICVKAVAHITGSNSEEEKEEKEANGREDTANSSTEGGKEEIRSTDENDESDRAERGSSAEQVNIENQADEVVDAEGEPRAATEEKSDAKLVSPEAKKEEEIKGNDGGYEEAKESTSLEVKENEEVTEDDGGSTEGRNSASMEVKEEEEKKEDDGDSLEASRSTSPEVKKKEAMKEDDTENLEASKSASLETNKKEEIKEDDSENLDTSKSVNLETREKEEMKKDDSEFLEATVVEGAEDENDKAEDPTSKDPRSVDLSGEIRSVEDGSDEMTEENFVEEDTPLAVSRSASQCTTRRVSSGNLAKLREDPTLGWTEETEGEIGNENEASPSKLKFSKIGGQTIREQGSDEIEPSQDSPSPGSGDAREILTKDSREYHIYVPDVDASEDNSTTESSTVDSAVTKIQARVRGFLTRRRMHRGQHNRSSTLSSIPSIQDSVAVEPPLIDGEHPEAEQPNGGTDTLPMTLDDPGLENAATRIQSNYRGYKARKRLRREDAVQRTTLSLEKSFADSGLQHTGEFHDCVPLPIHDVTLGKNFLGDRKINSVAERSSSDTLVAGEICSEVEKTENDRQGDLENHEGLQGHEALQGHVPLQGHEALQGNEPLQGHEPLQGRSDLGTMFFGQSSTVPLVQFALAPKIDQLVDLMILAKEETNLEDSYLNFITSVEDAEAVEPRPVVETRGEEFGDATPSESLKEPLALSAPPVGVVIEEVTSSDFEALLDRPAESTLAEPEASTESSGSSRAPCASSETISGSTEGSKPEDVAPRTQATRETPESRGSSSNDKGDDGLPTEMTPEDFGITEQFSLPREIELLGPESSVDSMEYPVVGTEDKKSSRSSGDAEESGRDAGKIGEHLGEEKFSVEGKDSSPGVEVVEDNAQEEEPFVSHAEEASSTLSFSLKVEDFLGLGSEDSADFQGRKPILEVTLTPGDILKSMSLSQESQLAGERMESPITMVQMAPARSESLQLEEDEETGGKPISPGSVKSGRKNS